MSIMEKKQEVIYHFTCKLHLPSILNSGHLALTECNFWIGKPMPPVIWLTTSPSSENMGLCFGDDTPLDEYDKTQVRFTIKKKSYMKNWNEWCDKTGRSADEKEMLIATAGAEETHKTWYISEQIIPFDDIVKIENLVTGEEISIPKIPVTPLPKPIALNPTDEYILNQSAMRQVLLLNVREAIREALSNATEKISYGMPAFYFQGRYIIAFAAAKNHLGLYPGAAAVEHFALCLTDYKTSKGTIQFPYEKFGAKQIAIITEIAAWCGNCRN